MPPAKTRLAEIKAPVLVATGGEDLSCITDITALLRRAWPTGVRASQP